MAENLLVSEEVENNIIANPYTGLEHSIGYDITPRKTLKKKKDWEKERLRDRTPIRGKFLLHESKNGSLSFTFYKYKGDPVESYTLIDGMEYTLPLGVVKHLNNNCGRPVHEYAEDAHGKKIMRIGYIERRCSFQPSDMYADDEAAPTPRLYTATTQKLIGV